MGAEELRMKTEDQLKGDLANLKKEAFNLRFQQANGQLENTARVRSVRREIAVAAPTAKPAAEAKPAPKAKAKVKKAAKPKAEAKAKKPKTTTPKAKKAAAKKTAKAKA